jgi:hypothetical protein
MTEPTTSRVPDGACLRCRGPLAEWGVREFRTGGTSGGAKLLFGEWAELGEEKVPLALRYCPACGQVDIRLPAPADR